MLATMTRAQRLATLVIAILLTLYAVFVTVPAMAQTGQLQLTCTPPTTNTDGTAIGSPITYTFYRGTTAASQTTASPVQTACAYTFTGLAVGTHYGSVTATVGGQTSVKSNPVSKVIAPPVPNPPSGLTVVQDLTAYIINQSDNRVVMVPAGTIPAGTACDSTQPVLGKYVVDIAAVAWAGSVRSRVAFATCS